MIIYGTKHIELKNIEISQPCSSCGFGKQILHIYRKFISLFYIPVFPLRKNALVICPNCGNENTKNKLLKQLSTEGKDTGETKKLLDTIVKEARVPIYAYFTTAITLSILFGVLGYMYYNERQGSLAAAAYYDSPVENVLVIYRDEEEAFPYKIFYVPQFYDDGEAIVVEWMYAYKTLRDAKSDLDTVSSMLTTNSVAKNFIEPAVVPMDVIKELKLAYVKPLSFTVDLDNLIQQWPQEEDSFSEK